MRLMPQTVKQVLNLAGIYMYRRPAEEVFYQRLIDRTENFANLTWMGRRIWQSPLDLWTIQETLAAVRPALLIETGTNKGGSAEYYAYLFDRLGYGQIVTMDVAVLHKLSHPRVRFLLGSSTDPSLVNVVRDEAAKVDGPVMVILDSDHSKAHVLAEMEAYGPMVTVGSYLHVQDGITDHGFFGDAAPSSLRAIETFVPRHPEFVIDHEKCERFIVTHHPSGWLKRVR